MLINKPMIIAHRGAKGMAPENTRVAFQLGLSQGCEGIELDVHLTADDEIVVCHDMTLDRTTDGKGLIAEKSLSEIKTYDAGFWFGDEFKGETVPTLDEVFDLVPDSIMINVEIKYSYDGRMEHKIVEILRRRNRLNNVIVSSFDHKCVRRIKQMESEAKIGLLYQSKLLDPTAYARSFDVEVYSLHPYFEMLDAEDVLNATESGLYVYPYTANEVNDLLHLTGLGVSGIITNFPGRLKDLLQTQDSK
ncbi:MULTISPECIES: glycerophosphodiester phosphodiesterase [unclassified Paenibacillus]|uniref:glycerophosphodiester phosphodiesterase n=1 Tax=unclassified Paenibacillus TaxID=185978 RepID=UPI002789EF23|nr:MULTISPECIES: glycerophosphodiester phosphodiesterase [unclassified Paenibacillus]MDQ0897786.1 glycerophosphoryl diester phosphodiesterase [Paenibacillus sp. V4I7]MDQ0916221.1 glycerophosphoryl diester phosphodiesterase [Paenibacillus sp. V4I5]